MPKKTFDIVTGQGSQIIAQVKGNQPTLLDAVQHADAQAEPLSQARQFDHARNRIERREVKVFAAAPLLAASPVETDWSALIKAVIQVHRNTDCFDTRTGTGRPHINI